MKVIFNEITDSGVYGFGRHSLH